jgi:hypothetical protein
MCRYIFLSLALAVFAVPALAQADCKVFYDSSDKMMSVPHRLFTTMGSPSGGEKTRESIFVDGASYIQLDGKWEKSRMTAKDLHDVELENRKTNKNISCKIVRSEVIDGEAATVYMVHSETEDVKADATVWLSKTRGLVMREEINPGTEDHIAVRYEYSNVTAPTISPK